MTYMPARLRIPKIKVILSRRHVQPTSGESECILAAYKPGGFTLKEIAEYRGMRYSTVSRIVSQIEEV